jgi:hypothetical protein
MNKSDERRTIFWRKKDLYQYPLGFVSSCHPGKRQLDFFFVTDKKKRKSYGTELLTPEISRCQVQVPQGRSHSSVSTTGTARTYIRNQNKET